MRPLLHMGEVVSVNAHHYPDRLGARDLSRAMTFRQWDERAGRLANALLGLGLYNGDRVEFIRDEDMPRTATGKILHRLLRDRTG